jgi:hypothetical protein
MGNVRKPDLRYPDAMDMASMLAALRREHEQITQAIISLERMATSNQKRRGRPPAWMVAARQASLTKKRGRPPRSRDTRAKP